MSTKIIVSGSEIKDEDVTELLFNLIPTDEVTIIKIVGDKRANYIELLDEANNEVFIDKHSIDNLILALQEAQRLWGDK